MCGCLSHAPLTGDLARNPGMCLDWESNQQHFGSQMLNPLSHTSQGQIVFHSLNTKCAYLLNRLTWELFGCSLKSGIWPVIHIFPSSFRVEKWQRPQFEAKYQRHLWGLHRSRKWRGRVAQSRPMGHLWACVCGSRWWELANVSEKSHLQ